MNVHNDMSLVDATIYKNYRDSLLNEISKIHNIHIKPKEVEKSELKKQKEEETEILEQIKKLRQGLNTLFKKLDISESELTQIEVSDKEEFIVKDIQELISHTLEEIYFYTNRINELDRYIAKATIELESTQSIKACYQFLEKFNLNRFSLTYFKELDFKVYTTFTKNLENLKALFEFSQFPNFHQTSKISEDRVIFFIIYPKDQEEELKERVSLIHGEEVNILLKYLTYDKINFERINKEIGNIQKTLSKYKKELTRIRNENLQKFAAIDEIVENIEEYNWASMQFEDLSATRARLQFYIPTDYAEEIEKYLLEQFKEKIIIKVKHIARQRKAKAKTKKVDLISSRKTFVVSTEGDEEVTEDMLKETPTIMSNWRIFRPFESITKMYGTPAYSEIDPTPFIAITFPLIFGLMFGDIGHGLCLVIAGLMGAYIFRSREGNIYNFSWVIFACGLGAILGGFLYGEFFGYQKIDLIFWQYQLEPVFIPILNVTLHDPLENIMTVLMFAILLGVFHINLGWVIQFVNYWRQSKKFLAFTDSFMKILLLIGGTILIFGWGFSINSWFEIPYPILLPLIPGLLLLLLKPFGKLFGISYFQEESYGELIGEGSIETFETVLSVVSNVASYIRLLALALAHLALMLAIQSIITLLPGDEWYIQVLRVIGLIFGNVVVILLEGLLVFLNTVRLHFYEFFFKFYQGSGTEFYPFYLDNKYSEIKFRIDTEKDVISEEIEKEINIENAKENIERAKEYISGKYL